ncbi:MAG TPA: acetamidase/formamidase family protein [Anaerolineae bacterium]|nr:acetamidase/formamidase family protein [Anaerolineae bacterium]
MKTIERRHKVFQFSRDDPPAAEVEPGELVLVETTDSLDGQIDVSRPGKIDLGPGNGTTVDPGRALPLTGPIAVRGAAPGDVLAAEIVGLVATGNAFILPEFGELLATAGAMEEQWAARVVELKRGKIQLTETLQLPYNFMVGCLGVAPAAAPADTPTPGDYGGNHDCIHFGQRSALYLQVQVPGALVSLGDVHAAMGDGESAGTAVECDGEVLLRFRLYPGRSIPGPVLETEAEWMVFGHGPTTDEAIAMAKHRAIDLLMRRLAVTRGDAYMVLAAVGHLRLNETVNPNCSARVEIPKYVADPLLWLGAEEPAAQRELAL